MGIMMLFLGGLIGTLILINRLTLNKKTSRDEESILDHNGINSIDQGAYEKAKTKPYNLVKTGFIILGLDVILILAVVNVFDLTNSKPFWEDWFALIAMLLAPTIAIFLIIRGSMKLKQLKKQFEKSRID